MQRMEANSNLRRKHLMGGGLIPCHRSPKRSLMRIKFYKFYVAPKIWHIGFRLRAIRSNLLRRDYRTAKENFIAICKVLVEW